MSPLWKSSGQLGYTRKAAVPNYPNGHAQYVYLKSLSDLA